MSFFLESNMSQDLLIAKGDLIEMLPMKCSKDLSF